MNLRKEIRKTLYEQVEANKDYQVAAYICEQIRSAIKDLPQAIYDSIEYDYRMSKSFSASNETRKGLMNKLREILKQVENLKQGIWK